MKRHKKNDYKVKMKKVEIGIRCNQMYKTHDKNVVEQNYITIKFPKQFIQTL